MMWLQTTSIGMLRSQGTGILRSQGAYRKSGRECLAMLVKSQPDWRNISRVVAEESGRDFLDS